MLLTNLVLAFRLVWAAGMGAAVAAAAAAPGVRRWLAGGAVLGIPGAILLQHNRWALGGRETMEAVAAVVLVALCAVLGTRRGRRMPLLWGMLGLALPQTALWDLADWPFVMTSVPAGARGFLESRLLAAAGGIALGGVLALVSLYFLVRLGRTWPWPRARVLVLAVLGAYLAKHLVVLGQVLAANQFWMPDALFVPLVAAINLVPWFPEITLGLGLLGSAAGLALRPDPAPAAAANPAEVRKQRAVLMSRREFALASGVMLLGFTCLSLLDRWLQSTAAATGARPSQPVRAEGDAVRLLRADLADGRVHQYIYTTEHGAQVPFLALQKGGGRYGLGLNYCQICGRAGYAERGDQIICLRCNSVVNRATVGLPGGCNPLPVTGTVTADAVIIARSELDQHEEKFAARS